MAPAASVESIVSTERDGGPASILAIGTANPPTAYDQSTYPDFYFNITNSNHMTQLKQKFKRICDKSGITKRHMYLTEDMMKANPNICAYWEKSLDVRQDMVVAEVPKLGKEAAVQAINEWGQPQSNITHLIFCTSSGIDMPGADWAVSKQLGLRPSVKRLMLYAQGCFAGGTVLRLAKDIAENNKNARVLVVCCEITAVIFRGPSETHLDSLVGQALFGDGAAALIVGSHPIPGVERPLFEIMWSGSNILPDTEGALDLHLREVGLTFHCRRDVPSLISQNIAQIVSEGLEEAFAGTAAVKNNNNKPAGLNDMFWVAHPGGPAILDQIEAKLQLKPHKMEASRAILRDYGNMTSACVLFILDYMRHKSKENRCATTGEGHEWGVLLGFGPGLTVETTFLRSVHIPSH